MIRKALARGDMKRVQNLVGRPFSLRGHVVHGAGWGIRLGFPTANLDIDRQQALPTDGVYASQAQINDKSYPSVTNIGQRPTFGRSQRLVEVYLLDYNDKLYGQELTVDIIERLRDERKFNTPQALREQIARDVEQGRAILKARGGN
jgi:riboflavin kinase/FMN adenylyltransferase